MTRRIVVFSGGSAANSVVDVFKTVADDTRCALDYVVPISDNGGSSSELIRFFGGPGIGDLRSRLVRLIPDPGFSPETAAIKAFFNHRLSGDAHEARQQWLDIVEARSPLWTNIRSDKKELIRSFLNVMNLEIVKRVRPSSTFNFSGASVGNLFLTAARLFSGSLESSVYLLSSICGIPDKTSVLPAVNTNFSHHIAAGLGDGTVIVGQNAISHPTAPANFPGGPAPTTDQEVELHDSIEDANLPGSLPSLRKPNITFSKEEEEDLPSRIDRIWYINPYGQEIRPPANPRVIETIKQAQCVIYSIGSLYTSIIPSLVLRGIGEALTSPMINTKILILNGSIDRETGPPSNPLTAKDFVMAISRAAVTSGQSLGSPKKQSTTPGPWSRYFTHLIYLESPDVPKVDRSELSDMGIETVKLYGRKSEKSKATMYDEKALAQALTAIIGKVEVRADLSRRNTLQQ